MSQVKNVLVFPCGSEIALEIYRSLRHSIHFNLIGGSSVEDHGAFVYENYIGDIPLISDEQCIPRLKQIVAAHDIDIIYPAMDAVMTCLKSNEEELGCLVVSSPLETSEICLSKSRTYNLLRDEIKTPYLYSGLHEITRFPVFMKPDIGYGSRGAKPAYSIEEIHLHKQQYPDIIISEFLSGPEYTVDCFTDKSGNLLFAGWRKRARVTNGISVSTSTNEPDTSIRDIAEKINGKLRLRGAWFFQLKEDEEGEKVLLEIADRLGGSSSVYRQKGINFAYLSLYTTLNMPVSIIQNDYQVHMDRALDTKYKADIPFKVAYFDFDDTILVHNKVNVKAIAAIYNFINDHKKIILITRHDRDINETLKQYRLTALFDEVIHLQKGERKSEFIRYTEAIFIDDSFAERKEVHDTHHIPVFSPDMLDIFNP